VLAPFEVMFEADLAAYPLPPELERLYGRLGFSSPVVYSNFVASVDGVVTLGSKPSAGSAISGRYPADRFVMGLLRACADAVVIGAGTMRATPGHIWTADHVYPDLAASFAALRKKLGRSVQPRLVLLTASGKLDFKHPALIAGATVVTTSAGATAIGDRLPETCDVVALGRGKRLGMEHTIGELRTRGYDVILTEGGPHVAGQMIDEHLLDEAFLTISPVMAGRGGETRLGMVEGVELLPGKGAWSRLLSARRHEDYLFLRYGIGKT
jgi:riboflavin biosynthesis pyrimidine reductase